MYSSQRPKHSVLPSLVCLNYMHLACLRIIKNTRGPPAIKTQREKKRQVKNTDEVILQITELAVHGALTPDTWSWGRDAGLVNGSSICQGC